MVEKLRELTKEVEKEGFRTEFNATEPGLPIVNTSPEAEHVLRVAETFYGKDNVGQGPLPFRASEDFGYFCKEKPGAFFFLSSARVENGPMLHSNNFDFNEDLIDSTGRFWLALARDRLEVSN